MKLLLLILSSFLLLSSNYPEVTSLNYGKEFIISLPPNLQSIEASSDNVKFVMFSPVDCEIEITIPNRGFKRIIELKAYEPNSTLISASLAQPFEHDGNSFKFNNLHFENSAIRFNSNALFSLLVLSDFEKSSDGLLALPVINLGAEYVISSWQDSSHDKTLFSTLPSNCLIISAIDNNTVTVSYFASENNEDQVNQKRFRYEKILNKGDVWFISSEFTEEDISGSVVQSTGNVSVISSNVCATIPEGNGFCDYIVDQEIPTNQWGNNYLVSGLVNRQNLPVVRVFASNDSTRIYRNNIIVDTIIFQEKENQFAGFVELTREGTQEDFVVSADKPIKTVIYNTGVEEDSYGNPTGSPFLMNLPPLDFLQNEIFVSNPDADGLRTFSNSNYITVVYKLEDSLDIDDLLIGFEKDGKFDWESLLDQRGIQNAEIIQDGEEIYAVIKLKFSFDNSFKLRGQNGVAAIIYGNKGSKSYGFAASYPNVIRNIEELNPPNIDWEENCGIVNGSTKDENELRWHEFTEKSINFNQISKTLISESQIDWTLEAIDKSQDASATITFYDEFNNESTVEVDYIPNNLTVEPKIIDFGEIQKNEINIQSFKIFNNTNQDIIIDSLGKNELPIRFFLAGSDFELNEKVVIQANSFVDFYIHFRADEDMIYDSYALAFSDCIDMFNINIKATVSSPIINVSDIPFQFLVNDEQSNTFSFSIKNTGSNNLFIDSITPPTNLIGRILNLDDNHFSPPLLIAPNSDDIEFVFEVNNRRTGLVNDSIIVHSNATEIDSVCYILGNLVNSGLIVRGFDWERRKISTEEFTFGPYKPSFDILVENENDSTFSQEIIDVKVNTDLRGEAFTINDKPIVNINNLLDEFFPDSKFIEKDQEIIFDIEFNPVQLGEANVDIEFVVKDADETKPAIMILNGFGTRPKLTIDIEQAPKVLIGYLDKSFGNIKIKNNDFTEWQFADNSSHIELIIDENQPHFKNFQIPKNIYQLGVGEELIIPFTFEIFDDTDPGIYAINVDLKTDALLDKERYVIATHVTDQDIEYNFSYNDSIMIACQGQKDQIELVIANNSPEIRTFEPLVLNPPLPQFQIANGSQFDKEFNLQSGESATIVVEFISSGDDLVTELIVKPKTQLLAKRFLITGQNFFVAPSAKFEPENFEIKIDEEKIASVRLTDVDVDNLESLEKLDVSIYYDQSYFYIDPKKIRLSEESINSFIIDSLKTDFSLGLINFNLLPEKEITFNENTNLIDFNLHALLPGDKSNYTNIQISIDVPGNNCVRFENEKSAEVEIISICEQDYSRIRTTDGSYYLSENIPNPISKSLNVDFGIGLPGNTTVQVFNSSGDLILILLDDYLEPGSHSFTIPADLLPNGIYFLRVFSGSWSKSHQFVVSK